MCIHMCIPNFRVFLGYTHVLTTVLLVAYVACTVGGGLGGVARFGVRVDGVLEWWNRVGNE